MKKLPWSWIVTFMWVGIVIAVPFFCSGIEKPSKLNEWGDYLAGAFSPLAFFWLIMGYLQQGKELQQNTKALELQAQELQNSVKQQEAQVHLLQKQLQKNLEWQEVQMNQREPHFILDMIDDRNIEIKNLGGEARKVVIFNKILNNGEPLRCGETTIYTHPHKIPTVIMTKFVNYLNLEYSANYNLINDVNGVRVEHRIIRALVR